MVKITLTIDGDVEHEVKDLAHGTAHRYWGAGYDITFIMPDKVSESEAGEALSKARTSEDLPAGMGGVGSEGL